jgi:DNA-binding NtrC family response regulator
VAWKRGDLVRAAAMAESSVELLSQRGHRPQAVMSMLLRAVIHTHAGEFDQARDLLVEVRGESTDTTRTALLVSEFLGDVHLEQGRPDEAMGCYDEVLPKALALVPQGDIVAELRRRRAECMLRLGRAEESLREALLGLDHCRELGDRHEEASTYRVLALSAAALGRASEAKRWFDQGYAYFDDIEAPYEWGKLWMAYGEWLSGPHAAEYADRRVARDAFLAASDHFDRMGAHARLAEVNARLAALDPSPVGAAAPRTASPAAQPAASRRPARRPRAQVEIDRRSAWAFETFGLLTRDRGVLDLLDEVAKLARSDAPLLVLGESGTGKELIATGVHRLSERTGQFMAINCGAMPRDMIESELFGHVAGAFTGATRDKPGLFETCQSGTAFLDEVGEMSVDLQSRLLRFLERNEARRVGSNRTYAVDTRVVAATNRDRAALERGEGFRPDLYYRLAHAVIVLPPLRRRGDDLQVLIDHFLAEFGRVEKKDVCLADSARDRLSRHTWPGNVRQLRAVIRRIVLLATPGVPVGVDGLQLDEGSMPSTLNEELGAAEKSRIVDALARARGSRTEAARDLGMPRTTLINRMQRHGLM